MQVKGVMTSSGPPIAGADGLSWVAQARPAAGLSLADVGWLLGVTGGMPWAE